MDRMKELAREILAEAKAKGAEYAQCSVSEGEKRNSTWTAADSP